MFPTVSRIASERAREVASRPGCLGSLNQGLVIKVNMSAVWGHGKEAGQHRGQKPLNGRLSGGA